jgi:fused signal recognition particle receptor
MADTGVKATEFLLADLKRRVKEAKATDPAEVKALLADAITELLAPLEKPLVVGEFQPTVMMVVGVNGAGKTTSIGKLTRHLADADQRAAGRGRHLPRRRARAAGGVGRPQPGGDRQPGRGDPAAVASTPSAPARRAAATW